MLPIRRHPAERPRRSTVSPVASILVAVSLAIGLAAGCSGPSDQSDAEASPLESASASDQSTTDRLAASDEDDSGDSTDSSARAARPVGLSRVSESDSVLAVIENHPDLTNFAALVAEHPQRNLFTQARGITILVPSDAAFEAGLVDFDTLAANPDAVTLFVSHHMTVGSLDVDGLVAAGAFTNAMAQSLTVSEGTGGPGPTVGEAIVIDGDLGADNGFVHVIDRSVPINVP